MMSRMISGDITGPLRAKAARFQDLQAVFGCRIVAARARDERPVNPYTDTLVAGVAEHAAEIDTALARHAEGWTVTRMPAVDRNILRIATWELLHAPDVPDEVAISQAVELAESLAGDDSPKFVNGVLVAIRDAKPERSDPPDPSDLSDPGL